MGTRPFAPSTRSSPRYKEIPFGLNRHAYPHLLPLALLLSVAYFLLQASDALLLNFLGEEHADAVVELGPYLRDAFGNATRIDYGSGQWPGVLLGLNTFVVQLAPDSNRSPANPRFLKGHELAFVAVLCCGSLLRIFAEDDAVALVTRVFNRCAWP